MPLLVNLQPAGKDLGEEYHRAGGVPAVVNELMKRKLIHGGALTVNGKTIGENCNGKESADCDVIFPIDSPLKADAGFIVLKGNLFDNAIMKTSVISEEFRGRYLSNPKDPECDGRQSGTSGSPSILNASPEAAAGGGLALLRTGDRVRVDLRKRAANILISEDELNRRRGDLQKHGFSYPPSQTPWQKSSAISSTNSVRAWC